MLSSFKFASILTLNLIEWPLKTKSHYLHWSLARSTEVCLQIQHHAVRVHLIIEFDLDLKVLENFIWFWQHWWEITGCSEVSRAAPATHLSMPIWEQTSQKKSNIIYKWFYFPIPAIHYKYWEVSGDKQFLPNCFQYLPVARRFFTIAREVKHGASASYRIRHEYLAPSEDLGWLLWR